MTELLNSNEWKIATETLKKITEKTEPISLGAFYECDKHTGFQEAEPGIVLFTKTVRELLSSEGLVFSKNGGMVLPTTESLAFHKNIFQGLMVISHKNNVEAVLNEIQTATEIVFADAAMKKRLWPAEMGLSEWHRKLGMAPTGYIKNIGYQLDLGVVLSDERREKFIKNGELKVHYHQAMIRQHPDLNSGEYSVKKSQDINNAYSILVNKDKFAKYIRGN
jgi:hypothetical protein